jgi:hypothetical protein
MVTVHYDKPDDEPASDWLGLGLPRALRPGTELERESKKRKPWNGKRKENLNLCGAGKKIEVHAKLQNSGCASNFLKRFREREHINLRHVYPEYQPCKCNIQGTVTNLPTHEELAKRLKARLR